MNSQVLSRCSPWRRLSPKYHSRCLTDLPTSQFEQLFIASFFFCQTCCCCQVTACCHVHRELRSSLRSFNANLGRSRHGVWDNGTGGSQMLWCDVVFLNFLLSLGRFLFGKLQEFPFDFCGTFCCISKFTLRYLPKGKYIYPIMITRHGQNSLVVSLSSIKSRFLLWQPKQKVFCPNLEESTYG
jgi:hypothetical protein